MVEEEESKICLSGAHKKKKRSEAIIVLSCKGKGRKSVVRGCAKRGREKEFACNWLRGNRR